MISSRVGVDQLSTSAFGGIGLHIHPSKETAVTRRTYRLRRLAVLALGAITVVSGTAVLGAGTAGALPGTPTYSAVTSGPSGAATPNVYPGGMNQPAANWGITLNNTFATGDTI